MVPKKHGLSRNGAFSSLGTVETDTNAYGTQKKPRSGLGTCSGTGLLQTGMGNLRVWVLTYI